MNQKLNPIAIVGLFAAIFILLFGTRVTYTVGPGQKAVVFYRFGKGLDKENVKNQGFHFIAPWNEKYIYNVRIQEDLSIMEVLSKNGLTIEGAEAGLEIIGSANGDHSSSLLLRNLNDGFAFINDNDANQLALKYFTATSDNFNVHGVGGGLTKLETSAIFKEDGAVELYNNNTKRLETAGHGAKVSGYLTMTAPVGFCAYRRDTGTADEYPLKDSSNAAINSIYFGHSSIQTPRGQLTTNTQYDNNGTGGSCFSHDGTKFTAPIAGVYTFTFNLSLYVVNDTGGDNSVGWGFFKNQSKIGWGTYDSGLSVTQSTPYVIGQDSSTTLDHSVEIGAPHLTIITTLAAGDEIQVGWDNMSKILGVRSFIFSGHLLG